jgi:hypothetical protein
MSGIVECRQRSNDRKKLCDVIAEPRDLVYRENKRGPSTEP